MKPSRYIDSETKAYSGERDWTIQKHIRRNEKAKIQTEIINVISIKLYSRPALPLLPPRGRARPNLLLSLLPHQLIQGEDKEGKGLYEDPL